MANGTLKVDMLIAIEFTFQRELIYTSNVLYEEEWCIPIYESNGGPLFPEKESERDKEKRKK